MLELCGIMGKVIDSCGSGICSDNRNLWYHLACTDLLPSIMSPDILCFCAEFVICCVS